MAQEWSLMFILHLKHWCRGRTGGKGGRGVEGPVAVEWHKCAEVVSYAETEQQRPAEAQLQENNPRLIRLTPFQKNTNSSIHSTPHSHRLGSMCVLILNLEYALMSQSDGEKQCNIKDSNHTLMWVFTYLGCAINILDRKDNAQAIEQHLGQRRDELCGGHQDIHTVWPTVEREREKWDDIMFPSVCSIVCWQHRHRNESAV